MSEEGKQHIPVMLKEVLDYLSPQPGHVIVDGTLGLGGHARAILEKIGPQGRLIAMDRDAQSLTIAQERLKDYQSQSTLIHGDFRYIPKFLYELNIKEVDGILLDLGISSFQLDNPLRGFSLRQEGPLDMRLDQGSYISAFDLINSLSEHELSRIIKEFGEERWHHRIAHALVKERTRQPLQSTSELCNVVMKAMPYERGHQRIHPATRTFQALRIAVNRELESLEEGLTQCRLLLKKGGRMAVISFHSLEDKIVKQQFRQWAAQGDWKLVVKKPLRPGGAEVVQNPRARSARLRIIERI
ncbi:MAG: 16S rRNA (cytosine(1402)-N(4))-methyltransferase RsmH [Candidatus Omnitrophota bacterium]|nr:16S rRNA (cytosine(1402)-N(4))-methyltransferase RsmH [Candidatus Omnitrophota bacterium]